MLLLAAQRFIRYAVAHIKCEKKTDRERVREGGRGEAQTQ